MYYPNFIATQQKLPCPNYGYAITPTRRKPRQNVCGAPTPIDAIANPVSTVLWPILFGAHPNWQPGLQGTGDCVSWKVAHMADVSDAVRNVMNDRWTELLLTASESIYGFGKCELKNSYNWHAPGMMGLDGIEALEKYGRLLRQRILGYPLETYDGRIATNWGERPRNTHGVPDELEPEAAKHKYAAHLEVTDTITAGKCINAGYPVGYCGTTTWGITTDASLNATHFSAGAHAMAITGVKYDAGRPTHFWVANTGHGHHVENPDNDYRTPEAYRACGSWLTADRIQPILQSGDCFIISPDGQWHVHQLLPACQKQHNLA